MYKTPCQHNATALDCIRVIKQLNQSINISVCLYASDYPCSNEVYNIPSCGRIRDNRGRVPRWYVRHLLMFVYMNN